MLITLSHIICQSVTEAQLISMAPLCAVSHRFIFYYFIHLTPWRGVIARIKFLIQIIFFSWNSVNWQTSKSTKVEVCVNCVISGGIFTTCERLKASFVYFTFFFFFQFISCLMNIIYPCTGLLIVHLCLLRGGIEASSQFAGPGLLHYGIIKIYCLKTLPHFLQNCKF